MLYMQTAYEMLYVQTRPCGKCCSTCKRLVKDNDASRASTFVQTCVAAGAVGSECLPDLLNSFSTFRWPSQEAFVLRTDVAFAASTIGSGLGSLEGS